MTSPDPRHGGRPAQVVSLDVHGTLVRLEPPVPRLRSLLAADGHRHPEAAVAAALAAEIRHYRGRRHLGRDRAGLDVLRRECAGVIARELGHDVPPPARLADLMVDSLRFSLAPDAVPALDALAGCGLRLAAVSNWDCSLADVLDGLGIAGRFEVIAASAVVGAAKPDPAIFRAVLGRMGADPARSLHCGDEPDLDCAGAAAAGMRAVLLDRRDARPDSPWPRVRSLLELSLLTGC